MENVIDPNTTHFRESASRMAEALEVAQSTCCQCIHWKRHASGEQGNLGDCYLNPPSPFPIQSQHPITGQVTMGLQMFRPITRDTEYCGYIELPGEADNDA